MERPHRVRVLLVEDNEDDYVIIRHLLSDLCASGGSLNWVSDYEEALDAVRSGKFDVCLLDYRLGLRTGLEFLEEAVRSGCQIPVIFLTGQGDYRVDMEAMKAGAADYLPKDGLHADLLERSIRYSIERARARRLLQEANDRRAKEALKESEDRYRTLFETMVQGVVYQNLEGRVIDANPAARKILGLTRDQMQGKTSIDPWWRTIHEDGTDFSGEKHPSMIALRSGKEVRNVVMGVYNPQDGDYRWININAVPQFLLGQSSPYQVYTTVEDITERKLAEEELRLSEEKFRSVFERSPIGILLVDSQSVVLDCNQHFADIFGAQREQYLGISLLDRLPEGPVRQNLFDTVSDDEAHYYEGPYVSIVTGKKLYLSISSEKVAPDLIISIIMDISERKQAEEALKKAVVEKDLLLKETHHRVKNNLQVIIGLIQMQARSSADAQIVQTLKELQERVRVMALVHEQLYRSHSFSEINFGQYLKELTDNLMQVFGSPGIDLEVKAGDIFLKIETVITCGLITTEIVTNALKYAFPGSRALHGEGEPARRMCVEFTEGESDYTLLVSDNGIGLPQGFDVSAVTSMGLHLVHLWSTYQLNGSIETRTDPGTTFTIRFPKRIRT